MMEGINNSSLYVFASVSTSAANRCGDDEIDAHHVMRDNYLNDGRGTTDGVMDAFFGPPYACYDPYNECRTPTETSHDVAVLGLEEKYPECIPPEP